MNNYNKSYTYGDINYYNFYSLVSLFFANNNIKTEYYMKNGFI